MVVCDPVWHHHHVIVALLAMFELLAYLGYLELKTVERGKYCIEMNLCTL
jgi:hypothetical protein